MSAEGRTLHAVYTLFYTLLLFLCDSFVLSVSSVFGTLTGQLSPSSPTNVDSLQTSVSHLDHELDCKITTSLDGNVKVGKATTDRSEDGVVLEGAD